MTHFRSKAEYPAHEKLKALSLPKRQEELEQEFLTIPCYEVVVWQKTSHLEKPLGSQEPCGACHICITRQAIEQDRADRSMRQWG